jgi:hypothetical protein
MELTLNLAWALLAALMFCLWLRFGVSIGPRRRMQFVALAVLILILLPVISVTDDLQAAQNPAEADAYYLCTRRDHVAVSPHSIFLALAALPLPVYAALAAGFPRFAAPRNLPLPLIDHPALAAIRNRPPPAV